MTYRNNPAHHDGAFSHSYCIASYPAPNQCMAVRPHAAVPHTMRAPAAPHNPMDSRGVGGNFLPLKNRINALSYFSQSRDSCASYESIMCVWNLVPPVLVDRELEMS